MSSFFTLPGSVRKRKRSENAGATAGKKPRAPTKDITVRPAKGAGVRRKRKDEEISSEDEVDDVPRGSDDEDTDEEHAGETAAERRLRLAQQYLENIRGEVDEGGFDAAEIDRDLIAERLKEDVAEEKGRLHRFIAAEYDFDAAISTLFRTADSPTTGIAVCAPHIYTVSKDRHLNKWLLPDFPIPSDKPNHTYTHKPKRILYARGGRKDQEHFNGHIDAILCVAASSDGKFVVTGGRDSRLVVWDAKTLTVLKVFKQHRSPVNGVVFRRHTNQLYSCSSDRTIKLWSLGELAYVETLFGHQDEVASIAALAAERCITVGARDRTARLWKIVDETQLVFRGPSAGDGKLRYNKDGTVKIDEGSIDCVVMIDDEHFVTGADNGALALWNVHKKKPIHVVQAAHGYAQLPKPEESSAEMYPPQEAPCPSQPMYITALAGIPYSDLIFSGSWDGAVRVWCVSADKRKLEAAGVLGAASEKGGCEEEVGKGIRGVVNGLAVFERGQKDDAEIVVCVGTGREMRLGRWMQAPGRNGGYVIEIRKKKLLAIEAAATKMEE